jgi:hypothetical protein
MKQISIKPTNLEFEMPTSNASNFKKFKEVLISKSDILLLIVFQNKVVVISKNHQNFF